MRPSQVSLVQMNIKFGEKKVNLKNTEFLMTEALSQALPRIPRIICLPELFSTGYDLDNVQQHAERIPEGETTRFLQEMAKKFSAVIVASFIEIERENYYNTAVIIDETGVLIGKYRKIHLFPPMKEPEVFSIGGFLQDRLSFTTKSTNLGVLICYDLRFPELSRRVTLGGNSDVLVYLAEFPHPKYEVWTRLLQARAIENQIFVCGVNRVGSDSNFQYFGHSVIYDPGGNLLIEGADKEEVLTAQLDPLALQKVRSTLPSLQHRQPDFY
ncbi:MAG: nitrilase-related carbon-nitrogen hydrolase [Candidatus Thorarchaeota archaeon]